MSMKKISMLKMKQIAFLIVVVGCTPKPATTEAVKERISDDSLFTLVQYKTFEYFWDGAEPVSGMARERIHEDGIYPDNDKNVVTTTPTR